MEKIAGAKKGMVPLGKAKKHPKPRLKKLNRKKGGVVKEEGSAVKGEIRMGCLG